MPVVDVWMQHPTLRHSNHEMFESLRRWTGMELLAEPLPVKATVAALAAADVEIGLSAAWYGPQGPLISNDEVAEFVERSDGRLRGVAGVDLSKPVAAVRELRRAVDELGFVALRIVPWLWQLPPTTGSTTRCTPLASNSESPSAPRSGTPDRCAPPRPAGPSRTSTRSRSTSPN
jgi:hypothetical protein